MLKVKHNTPDIRIRLKARTERGEQMVRELAKHLGVDLAPQKKPRKPRKQD